MSDDRLFRARVFAARGGSGDVGRPVIVWRRAGCCRQRLLVVYLRPSGWHVIVERFRVRRELGAERLGLDAEAARYAPNIGAIRGGAPLLPLQVDDWPPLDGRFEVGCDHHLTSAPLAWLAEDVMKFREQPGVSRHVKRDVQPRSGNLTF